MAIAIRALLMSLTLLTTSAAFVDKDQEDHAINARSTANVSQNLQDVGLNVARQTDDLKFLRNKVIDLLSELASVKSTLQKRAAFSAHFSEGWSRLRNLSSSTSW